MPILAYKNNNASLGEYFFTMEALKAQNALGLMSGSSLQGVRAALIRTDGVDVFEARKSLEFPFDDGLAEALRRLHGRPEEISAEEKDAIERRFTEFNLEIVNEVKNSVETLPDIIGFHGHTLFHKAAEGLISQLGDSQYLADKAGIRVVGRFRHADIAAGGQGAPLSPIYHMALAQKLDKPAVFLNIGGLASLTWIGANGEMKAFDVGVGLNAVNDWVFKHAGQHTDYNGSLAASGQVNGHVLAALMRHKFLAKYPPKAADKYTFREKLENLEGLSLADGAATATSFIAEETAYSMALYLPEMPSVVIVCGEGARNPTLLRFLRQKLINVDVQTAEYYDMDSEGIEAQAFAYLAVRRLNFMPTSYPFTTGVAEPVIGGEIFEPRL